MRRDVPVLYLDLWCTCAYINRSDIRHAPETIRQRERKTNDNQAAQHEAP
jgi:hypothetical protein